MQRLALVEHKELTCRKCGATFVFEAEDRRSYPKHGRGHEPSLCPVCRGVETEADDHLSCHACGGTLNAQAGQPSYCQRCYQETAMESEALARQESNRAEALASERDALALRVDELTKLLQSRECQIKKLSSRVESLERDWRNVTEGNQELRQTLQNTELRLANAELERRLVVSQYQDAGLQEVQAAIDTLRREVRCKEQKMLERLVTMEKAMVDHSGHSLRSSFIGWFKPQDETGKAPSP